VKNGEKLLALLLTVLLLSGCRPVAEKSPDRVFSAGFGNAVLTVPTDSDEPLYIAGYHNGWEITGILDEQQARALWLDDGVTSAVLIVVDCIGLSRGTVTAIRERLADFCSRTGCDSVNVVATHTHAGIDTLGLWGSVAMDGKNSDFTDILIDGAVRAAEAAYADGPKARIEYVAPVALAAVGLVLLDPAVHDGRGVVIGIVAIGDVLAPVPRVEHGVRHGVRAVRAHVAVAHGQLRCAAHGQVFQHIAGGIVRLAADREERPAEHRKRLMPLHYAYLLNDLGLLQAVHAKPIVNVNII